MSAQVVGHEDDDEDDDNEKEIGQEIGQEGAMELGSEKISIRQVNAYCKQLAGSDEEQSSEEEDEAPPRRRGPLPVYLVQVESRDLRVIRRRRALLRLLLVRVQILLVCPSARRRSRGRTELGCNVQFLCV